MTVGLFISDSVGFALLNSYNNTYLQKWLRGLKCMYIGDKICSEKQVTMLCVTVARLLPLLVARLFDAGVYIGDGLHQLLTFRSHGTRHCIIKNNYDL